MVSALVVVLLQQACVRHGRCRAYVSPSDRPPAAAEVARRLGRPGSVPVIDVRLRDLGRNAIPHSIEPEGVDRPSEGNVTLVKDVSPSSGGASPRSPSDVR